ncbi:D-2-hydroxyacid dehydrogenase [Alkalicoccus luteus]|uniref:D-2-hydroxyacid dehydrogenase n=1 Tax=Alkalicoccus luteus TaxID=1237094 RepID=A0A969PVT6_9BACI|nr:D-2-hydroxyacid dehydrogenase [Alkalicoccus luteus]NJP39286.1 D-2-hydroxyacid dehydrogenase [Alkalicoccus luteus]
MRTIVIAQDLNEELSTKIRKAVPDWNVIIGREKETWEPWLPEAEAAAGWKADMMEHAGENLQWVQTWSAGVDHLPLDTYFNRGIRITSANGVHAAPISETIFAFMLGWTRRMSIYAKQQTEKKWHHAGLKHEIHGASIIIYGMGAIGEETARLAKAFRMDVTGVRKSGALSHYADRIVTPEEADQQLGEADFIVNALPLTKETNQFFSRERLERMGESTFFINVGRGGTVDESAMTELLARKEIGGAGLDVFQEEPLPETNLLWEMDNVLISPHTAGSTEFYNERVVCDILLPNLIAYTKREALPVNQVKQENGY